MSGYTPGSNTSSYYGNPTPTGNPEKMAAFKQNYPKFDHYDKKAEQVDILLSHRSTDKDF